MKDTLESRQA
jgi:hypothetical protein